ncbi:hypothetical protein HGO97_012430 [Faecalicatena sp. AGMB00832]|uniref:WXG100 family type VII secretion target n=1 Tax=Faecalicatena faecalis TaxID=2726362 RepID=A0ABS6D5P2_9FIRM|nr:MULTISPECIES: hypothetical protein [Faecalicatena]MBU3876610.1 hypothetical protein [Faecalicatena faecalis]MCI6464655.1 hypothetical protein [Faecalicatena sp.]MDY5618233.1 hypothetical protein [Lachnospiraceae bacterium]
MNIRFDGGMDMIEFDFELAEAEEQRLENTAERLKQTAENSYLDIVHKLRQGWQGESAGKFVEKAVLLQEKMERTFETVHLAKDALRRASVRAEQVEKSAEEIVGVKGRNR